MGTDSDDSSDSLIKGVGALVGMLTGEVGAAVGILSALLTGYIALAASNGRSEHPWLYAVAGGTFVAVAYVCRGNSNAR